MSLVISYHAMTSCSREHAHDCGCRARAPHSMSRMSPLPRVRAPCNAQQGQASSPHGGPSGPRAVGGEERCGETGGEVGVTLTLLIPAAVFPSCFGSLSLLPAIVGSHSVNQSL